MSMTHGTDALLLGTGLPEPGQQDENFPDPERAIHVNGAFRSSIPRTLTNAGFAGGTSGRLLLTAVSLFAGEVVHGVTFVSQANSSGLTHSWAALYDSARNLMGVSNDITTLWDNSQARRFEMVSPITIPIEGTFYVGLVRTATSSIGTLGGTNTVLGGLMNHEPRPAYLSTSGLTTPNSAPSTAPIGAAMTQVPFVAVD